MCYPEDHEIITYVESQMCEVVPEDEQAVLSKIFQLRHVIFTHMLNTFLITHTLIGFAD